MNRVLRYHDVTKHDFNRFARSLGYLDWASQPDPFRRYTGAPLIELPRGAVAADLPYSALFDGNHPAHPLNDHSIAEFLRCSMGLSAWKQYGTSRWALRVNPSSGNLHPTEAFIVTSGRVCHYAPREHALEERCVLDADQWRTYVPPDAAGFLVALTSIHWREAWKYGERAFRYCQHDAGHAIGALRLAAALLGWRCALLPRWSDRDIAAVLGIDRDEDFAEAERDDPDGVAVVTPGDPMPWHDRDPAPLVDAARRATWRGQANRLSTARVDWPIIDEVAEATRYPGSGIRDPGSGINAARQRPIRIPGPPPRIPDPRSRIPDQSARSIILQRRSALAFDGRSTLPRATFFSMLRCLRPPGTPWDVLDWPPQVHLALFVHRVEGMIPGIYAYLRDPAVLAEWKAAMRPEFLWEPVNAEPSAHPGPPEPSSPEPPELPEPAELFLLVPMDVRMIANRVSCDQDIAEDGFFSLGMLARFEASLRERGEWFYRRLFWECGLIGQVLYLEAEAAGARSTGIGCFYDDPVHDVLGLTGHAWQDLYHFSIGMPVEDRRLTSEPGYGWE